MGVKPDTDIDLFSLYFHLHISLEREINGTAETIIESKMVLTFKLHTDK